VLQGAWGLLLARYAGAEEAVFGNVVSGRGADVPGIDEMVGMLINTLPVRVRVPARETVSAWLRALQAHQAATREVEYAPLAEVTRWAGVESGRRLFDTLFIYENYPIPADVGGAADAPDASGELDDEGDDVPAIERTEYPLAAAVIPGERLALRLTYDPERFDADDVRRLGGHFRTLVESIPDHGDAPVADLPLMGESERALVLDAWNRTAAELPADATIDAWIRAQAARTPDAPAVRGRDAEVTYAALMARADAIAIRLRALGVGAEARVGLAVERGAEMVAAMLGIWRAGAAYVPLEAAHPHDRLRFVMDDAGIAALVADRRTLPRLPDPAVPVLVLEDVPAEADGSALAPAGVGAPESLAYVIYTSGSTGRPKGVMVAHVSAAAFLAAMRERPGSRPTRRSSPSPPRRSTSPSSSSSCRWSSAHGWSSRTRRRRRTPCGCAT
jgi:non-ribosomal peptide synthetase component F